MGLLVEGEWQDKWYDTKSTGGKFERYESVFRHWLSADGHFTKALAPKAERGFVAEPGRYRLYVSLACPWAHRTLIVRALKGLEELLPVTVVSPLMLENGWEFAVDAQNLAEFPECDPEPLYGASYLHELYTRALPNYSGRVTVPVLWDTKEQTIVNNESSEIIRMLSTAFDGFGAKPYDFYPEALRGEIDEVNERVYHEVNNGVYKAGFATTQTAYMEAVSELFGALDWLEERLSSQRYLVGEQLTEADIRLFTTLLRFDPVYEGHFKCNIRTLREYSALFGFLKDLYQTPGVADTCNLIHIQNHYYRSHPTINPNGIVPAGPALDLSTPHGRETLAD